MKKDDHLDKETSVSAELTPTGVKASAKSRLVAAVDRFGGNLLELMNAPIEARVAERRAIADSRVLAIETVAALGIERLKTDPDFAERAMRSHLDSVFAGQENKDAVLAKTIEDLRSQPPTDADATSGPETLDEAFVHRFNRFAEAATTEELREKWGRVLAQEIRKPDTFSAKVLRVVDELDSDIAALFERFCENRLDDIIPKALSGELTFEDSTKLVGADLLIDPGFGQFRLPTASTDSTGGKLWTWRFGERVMAADRSDVPIVIENQTLLQTINLQDGKPCLTVYVLTAVGTAIATILPDRSDATLQNLAPMISDALPLSGVRIFAPQSDGLAFSETHNWPPKSSTS